MNKPSIPGSHQPGDSDAVSAKPPRHAARWPVALIAASQLGLHLWVNAHDNFFRDEFYYIAASRHLDFGYVDFPPLIAWLTAVVRLLLGQSLIAIRLLPALAAVATILLTADMVRRLGGGNMPQVLAAAAVALGPVFIGSSGLLTVDPFDQFWWTLGAWTVLRIIAEERPRLWLLFGLFVGLGLLNKLTVGFYAAALVVGVLISDRRRLLFNRWLLFAGVIALVLIAPYIAWNAAHGFPTFEFTRNYAAGKTFQATPLQFLASQVSPLNPFALPLWLGGLYFVFFSVEGKPYRPFGWAYLLVLLLFMALKTKFYWLSPAYPVLFALGAYGLELFIRRRPSQVWRGPAYVALLAITGLLLVPFAIPILPVQSFIRLQLALGGVNQVKTENLATSILPQNYADRYGWVELVAAVQHAADTLTPQEKAQACVFTSNYGEAGAIDFYGPALGLPRAISGHNSYFIWGPQGCTGQVLITVGIPLEQLMGSVDSIRFGGQTECTLCMPFENEAPIFIARGLHLDIRDAWPQVKSFN